MTFFTWLESWLWLLARSSVGAVSQALSQHSSMWLGWALHFTQHGSPMPPPPECKSRSYYFFLRHTVGKESDSNTGDPSSIPGWRRSLEKGMATHSSILAWRIPWTEEPGQLQSMESQRVRHNRETNTHTHMAQGVRHDWATNTHANSIGLGWILRTKASGRPAQIQEKGTINGAKLRGKIHLGLPKCITKNKASGGDGIPVELFQILKDNAVKVLCSICQQIWKTQQWPQDWKRSVFIPVTKKGNAKECSNYRTIALISHASKVMLKILQSGFSNTWTVNFQMFNWF